MAVLAPAVMSGGVGSRLWPLSRRAKPKQFHALATERSMLAETILRTSGLKGADVTPPLIICNAAHGDNALKALDEAGAADGRVILEPEGRNTAAAAALACHAALEFDSNALVLLLPADHHIRQPEAFRAAVADAVPLAQNGRLVTFGITPDAPETGYGYIQRGEALDAGYDILRFVEKPDRPTAEGYLASGDYSWNAGIFLLNARAFLDELADFRPDIAEPAAAAYAGGSVNGRLRTLDAMAWEAAASDSIDYAVAEKTKHGAVLPVDMGWSDVGSWTALHAIASNDDAGNSVSGDVVLVGAQSCYARADGDRLIAVVGGRDLIIVDTPDAVLVAARDEVQDVKRVVDILKDRNESDGLV